MDEPKVDFGGRRAGADPAPAAPPPPPLSPAFRALAEQWKRRLLDVSRRNRAINFRAGRSTLTLPAEPALLWDTLLRDEGDLAFDARDFAPEAARPDDDDRVKGAFAAATRLAERARLADREQGVQVLFVALGWLNWVEAESRAPMRSPLALVPVRLDYDRQGRRVVISAAAGDEPELNPSLAYLLQAQAGIRLPRLADEEGEPLYPTFEAFLAAIRPAVEKQPGWTVEAGGPVADVFAFAKLALVDAIDRSLDRMAAHPLLTLLAGGEAPAAAPPTAGVAAPGPGALRLVLEADAYQAAAVAMAARGESFVIEGPPGTGKSQTITNIIAELLAQQKRVIFVAEKRVAREVVLENLGKAGIAEVCLHLAANAGAGSKADAKAQVVNDIAKALETLPPPPVPDPQLPARVADLRARLDAYAVAIAAPLGDGGWTTAYDVIGEAEATRAARRDLPGIPTLQGATRFWLDDVAEEAAALDRVAADHRALLVGPWRGFLLTALAPGQADTLRAALETLAGAPTRAGAALAEILPPGPAAGDLAVADLDALRSQVEALDAYRRMSGSLLRLLKPAFYRARSARAGYMAAGYREPAAPAETAGALADEVATLSQASAAAGSAFASVPTAGAIANLAGWATPIAARWDTLPAMVAATATLARCEALGVRPAIEALLADPGLAAALAATIRASVYGEWARREVEARLPLTPGEHHSLVASLERAEAELTGSARSTTLRAVHAARPRPNDARIAPLLRFARAKRRPALRSMLGRSREAVQLLKPCLLMSPLAAAQYLCQEGDARYHFDACIVDEASMIPTPDLVVAMSLAGQVVVVGDSKQMPPTSFFQKEIDPAFEEDDDVTFESVLDELAPVLPSTMLRAHYRSRDDALIAFSNLYFYDGKLVAFPDPWRARPETGVHFAYVADAVYGRGASRANPAEAQRAVELLRAELQAASGEKHVAITAMSLAQQAEVVAHLEDAAMLDPLIRAWLEGGGEVRNLETVQGDECDIMILSIGYGRDEEGRLTLNFGPLGKEKGERRLNVAVTRARWKTIAVSSLRASDIDPVRTSSTGTLRLRDYLDYAERGADALPAGTGAGAGTGPGAFERVVSEALAAKGLRCVPRVGVGGYRVDIGVMHPTQEGRFILGIECDGPAYSGAPATRDREIGRPRALERMGWELERAWSAAWHRDPTAELARLTARYDALVAKG